MNYYYDRTPCSAIYAYLVPACSSTVVVPGVHVQLGLKNKLCVCVVAHMTIGTDRGNDMQRGGDRHAH